MPTQNLNPKIGTADAKSTGAWAGVSGVAVLLLLFSSCAPRKAPGEWVMLDTGTGDAFYVVNFVDENTGWLNGQTDRSSIPVEDNENANRKKEPAKKVEDPLKTNQGFEVLQTTDGGNTWRQIPDQFKWKIRSVWFVDPRTGWALTVDRDILHTTDGGATWSVQRKAGSVKIKLIGNRREPVIDAPEQIERIYFVDSQHGWAWGGGQTTDYTEQPGIFLATLDGGKNWNDLPYPFEQNVVGFFFLDPTRAWVSTSAGFYRTDDGGLNWSSIKSKRPEEVFNSIFFVDQSNGWIAGRSGRLAKTSDGGQTWTRMVYIKPEFVMRSVFFFDRSRGWAVGDNGAILYTPDGGDTWINAGAPLPAQLTGAQFLNPRAGWVIGLGGAVLKLQPN
jgi:photosystem II stability/assembly factor-like uncharacterized protein